MLPSALPQPDSERRSVCVFCGSSNAVDQAFLRDAEALGQGLAESGIRLVYGGGGVGLMGACARGAKRAGGEVLGILPRFLESREPPMAEVETVLVTTMHERKMMMFEAADAFVVLPGGIGTLEEVVELLSWYQLELHKKPVLFYNPDQFWSPLFAVFEQMITAKFLAPTFYGAWMSVENIEAIVPAIEGLFPRQ